MALRESLAAGHENVDRSDFTHGLIFATLFVTVANFLMMTFLFSSALTAKELEAVSKVASVGFLMMAVLPLVSYLAGVIEAFEWRSGENVDADVREGPS